MSSGSCSDRTTSPNGSRSVTAPCTMPAASSRSTARWRSSTDRTRRLRWSRPTRSGSKRSPAGATGRSPSVCPWNVNEHPPYVRQGSSWIVGSSISSLKSLPGPCRTAVRRTPCSVGCPSRSTGRARTPADRRCRRRPSSPEARGVEDVPREPVARAAISTSDASEDIAHVVAAAGPRGLAAHRALDGLAHAIDGTQRGCRTVRRAVPRASDGPEGARTASRIEPRMRHRTSARCWFDVASVVRLPPNARRAARSSRPTPVRSARR